MYVGLYQFRQKSLYFNIETMIEYDHITLAMGPKKKDYILE